MIKGSKNYTIRSCSKLFSNFDNSILKGKDKKVLKKASKFILEIIIT